MATSSRTRDKEKVVDEILANPTYSPESEIVLRLKSRLLLLSRSDLSNLSLVVEQKSGGWNDCKECGKAMVAPTPGEKYSLVCMCE